MNKRAAELIERLRLEPHPEGGYFREVFRSPHVLQTGDKRQERKAVTTIYYLLTKGEHSSWHLVTSDEVWHYYEGDPLELFWIEPGAKEHNHHLLGQVEASSRPVTVIPAGCWQAAKTTGEYTLTGCTVGPGFEYEDFRLLRGHQEEERMIRERFSELAVFI